MERAFTADISIKVPNPGKKYVEIVPFHDSDKKICKVLEEMINDNIFYDGEETFRSFESKI